MAKTFCNFKNGYLRIDAGHNELSLFNNVEVNLILTKRGTANSRLSFCTPRQLLDFLAKLGDWNRRGIQNIRLVPNIP